jgi:mono/diheme cytochrome c family protein
MSERKPRRRPSRAYRRYLRAVVIGGVLLLMLAIVTLALRPRPPGGEVQAVGALVPGDRRLVAEGRAVYERACAACHGAELEGHPAWAAGGEGLAPPLDASGPAPTKSDADLIRITSEGAPGMPGYGASLTGDEIRAALSYMKSSWSPAAQTAQPAE